MTRDPLATYAARLPTDRLDRDAAYSDAPPRSHAPQGGQVIARVAFVVGARFTLDWKVQYNGATPGVDHVGRGGGVPVLAGKGGPLPLHYGASRDVAGACPMARAPR